MSDPRAFLRRTPLLEEVGLENRALARSRRCRHRRQRARRQSCCARRNRGPLAPSAARLQGPRHDRSHEKARRHRGGDPQPRLIGRATVGYASFWPQAKSSCSPTSKARAENSTIGKETGGSRTRNARIHCSAATATPGSRSQDPTPRSCFPRFVPSTCGQSRSPTSRSPKPQLQECPPLSFGRTLVTEPFITCLPTAPLPCTSVRRSSMQQLNSAAASWGSETSGTFEAHGQRTLKIQHSGIPSQG